MVVLPWSGEVQPWLPVLSLGSVTARDPAAVRDDVAGEDEEDAPHAREEGGGDEAQQHQPVPETQLPHLGQGGVVVRTELASIRTTHHCCSDRER